MLHIHFIPNLTNHIDITIDGIFWHTCHYKGGNVTIPLSFNQYNKKIHVLAVGQEERDATIEVLWDGDIRQVMNFDGQDGENKDVER